MTDGETLKLWKKLQARMPEIGAQLGKMMSDEAIGGMIELGFGIADVIPSVSIGYADREGRPFKVTLSIEFSEPPDTKNTG